MSLNNFINDNELNIFFNDFYSYCNILKNNKKIKILFYDENENKEFQNFSISNSNPYFLIKDSDYKKCEILKDDIIKINNNLYIIDSIEISNTNIHKIEIILKD